MKPAEKTAQIDRMRRRSESSDLTSEGSQEDKPTNLLVASKQANGILLTQPKEIIPEDPPKKESSCRIGIQVFFPFLIAGFGMVSAGMLLDYVQHWPVFMDVNELFILVPALLGLKGNLEMTLASRLSTAANTGAMDTAAAKKLLILGNMALIQAQALVIGALASFAAVLFGWLSDGVLKIEDALLLCASSLITASVASFALGGIMIIVILLSKRFHVNPDNVATPIAASLGDLVTLALLAGTSNALYAKFVASRHLWVIWLLCSIFLSLIPVWIYISHRNPTTRKVLSSGWTPVISAMLISSGGGLVLDQAVSRFPGIAVYSPVMNGVGGNLVAVHASRLSTTLHGTGKPGDKIRNPDAPKCCGTFRGQDHGKAARVLLMLTLPGHLIFLLTISYVQAGHTSLTLYFAGGYFACAILQVALLLSISTWLVYWMWNRGNDPDNFCIPYLTALGDLLGTGLLALTFVLLYQFGDKDSDVGT